jgi:DNA modification methylase
VTGEQLPEQHQIAETLLERKVPIDDLEAHPLNARRRDARAENELRTSLQVNGQYRAVVARRLPDGRTQLLAGHGTTEQARHLGWTHLAAEVHDDVDDATAARIVAVDNRTSDLAGYDPAAEQELLDEIRRLTDGSLEGTGYNDDDYLDVLERATAGLDEGGGLTDEDAVPDPPASPRSSTGDTWLLGPHRLAVGDATDPDVVARATGGKRAAMLLTDPPYNVSYTGKTAEALTIQGDTQEDQAFRAFLLDLFAAALQHTRKGGPAYVFHADTERVNFELAFREAGWETPRQVLQWVKDRFVLGRQDHHWQHEPILYGWRPGATHRWYGGRTLTTVLDDETDVRTWSKDQMLEARLGLREESATMRAARPAASRDHPTMKPVHLLVRLLERSTRRSELVLDVCAGSGPLAIACHQLGRRAAMVEKDPTYADVICRRWEEHTGQAPRLETGEVVSFVPEEAAS